MSTSDTIDPAAVRALAQLLQDSDPTSDVTITRNGTRPGREDLPEHVYTLGVSRVEDAVSLTMWVMDTHEWSGDDIVELVSRAKEMGSPACTCDRCSTRRNRAEWARRVRPNERSLSGRR